MQLDKDETNVLKFIAGYKCKPVKLGHVTNTICERLKLHGFLKDDMEITDKGRDYLSDNTFSFSACFKEAVRKEISYLISQEATLYGVPSPRQKDKTISRQIHRINKSREHLEDLLDRC